MGRLLLVRHAESAWNAVGRWQGHADPPLSERGRAQAKRAAARLTGIVAVASSDLRRAHETALVIAAELSIGDVAVHEGLRERDVGVWSGLTATEVDEGFPGYRAVGKTPPGWESDEELLARVLPVIAVIGGEGSTVLVVSHGGVLRALERHLGLGDETSANLEGRWLEVTGDVIAAGGRVVLGAD